MRTDYENTVYAIGALTVLIERDDTMVTDRAAMLATRQDLLERVPRLLDELHAWAVEELARAWFDSPIWPIVRVDPVLGRDPVWSVMYRAAQLGPINSDPCPF